MTDDGIELIAENLRKLVSLDLSWCPRITDAALEYIACDLTHLEELTLDRSLNTEHIHDNITSTGYPEYLYTIYPIYILLRLHLYQIWRNIRQRAYILRTFLGPEQTVPLL